MTEPMKRPHLFEFCDQRWVPASLRQCLFEYMSLCLEGFRDYYREVADAVLDIAREHELDTIVELGAGLAPITRRLAEDPRSRGLTLVPCDLNANEAAFRELAARFPGQVEPLYESVDMTEPPRIPGKTLYVISGSWHHLRFPQRAATFQSLTRSAEGIAVFEALQFAPASMLLTLTGVFPALLLPLARLHRPGRFRRIFWCWIVPAVPLFSLWDGIVSCLRQWTAREWQNGLAGVVDAQSLKIEALPHRMMVVWTASYAS